MPMLALICISSPSTRKGSPKLSGRACASQSPALLGPADVGLQDDELVAAEMPDDVALAETRREAIGDAFQEMIAGDHEAEGVVHALEAVEIHQQHGAARLTPSRALQGVFDIAPIDVAIGQVGQRIMRSTFRRISACAFLSAVMSIDAVITSSDLPCIVEQRRLAREQDAPFDAVRQGDLLLEA